MSLSYGGVYAVVHEESPSGKSRERAAATSPRAAVRCCSAPVSRLGGGAGIASRGAAACASHKERRLATARLASTAVGSSTAGWGRSIRSSSRGTLMFIPLAPVRRHAACLTTMIRSFPLNFLEAGGPSSRQAQLCCSSPLPRAIFGAVTKRRADPVLRTAANPQLAPSVLLREPGRLGLYDSTERGDGSTARGEECRTRVRATFHAVL